MSGIIHTEQDGESAALSNSGTWVHWCTSPIIQGIDYWCPLGEPLMPYLTGSLDNIRQELHVRKDKFDALVSAVDRCILSDRTDYYTSTRIGTYRYLWTFHFGDGVAVLGLALNNPTKIETTTGFFEFNPNKLARHKAFYGVRQLLDEYDVRVTTNRFDIALDYAYERCEYTMLKDKRKYEYHHGTAITEYLGQRNNPGRVKLYDKQKESKLSSPLTRLEITCEMDWDSIVKSWPKVVSTAQIEGMNSTMRAMVRMLAKLDDLGEPIEPYIADLNKRTRSKIKQALCESRLQMPEQLILKLLAQVIGWEINGAYPSMPE